jgi:hypothetical protein
MLIKHTNSRQIGKLVIHELDLWGNLYRRLESYLAKVLVIEVL